MLKINCPHCKKEIEVSEEKLGEVVTCDSCKNSFVAESVCEADHPDNGVVYKRKVYSMKSIRQIRMWFHAFFVVFLIQCVLLTCLPVFSVPGSSSDYSASSSDYSALSSNYSFFLFIFVLLFLFVSFMLLLRALKESVPLILLDALLILAPIFLYELCLLDDAAAFCWLDIAYVMAAFCLLEIIRSSCKAIVILNASRKHSSSKSSWSVSACWRGFAGTVRRNAGKLVVLSFALFISAIFLGDHKSKIFYCRDCGIGIEEKDYVLWGEYTSFGQNAYSRFLDPEHRCNHSRKVNITGAEDYDLTGSILDVVGHRPDIDYYDRHTIMVGDYPFSFFDGETEHHEYHDYQRESEIRQEMIKRYMKTYMKKRGKRSSYYGFLCEVEKQDPYFRPYIRSMLSGQLDRADLDHLDDEYAKYRRNPSKYVYLHASGSR